MSTYNFDGIDIDVSMIVSLLLPVPEQYLVLISNFMSFRYFPEYDALAVTNLILQWEYPEADDRSGRPQDFANFPNFISQLKLALQGADGRDGLSITIPASYWYLQHFDIINLAKSVDCEYLSASGSRLSYQHWLMREV